MSLSSENFEFIRALLRERSANQLEDDKVYLVETRLLSLARKQGLESVDDLVFLLRRVGNEKLLEQIVETMTINETSFFRDGHPFDILRQEVLPELVRLRAAERRLHIWSAACSSGQEPYSVAILLREHFPELDRWNIQLLATDLSSAALERARRGRYTALEVSRGLSPHLLATYFQQVDNGWQINEAILRRVEFQILNLSRAWPRLPLMDLILLRNVLIYFDMSTKQEILRRIRQVLHPDGTLVLGGAETTHKLVDDFEPIAFGQSSFYRLRARR